MALANAHEWTSEGGGIMQKLILDKPDFKYMEYMYELLNLDLDDHDISIKYDLKFATPYVTLLIASYLNHHKYNVNFEIGEFGRCSESYARNYNFFHFAEGSLDLNERNTNYSDKYTPIMKSILSSYSRQSENIVENIANKIAKVLSCEHENIKKIFFYIVFELFRNIPEHSHCFEGWHASQCWMHDEYVEAEIAIIDYGIGFKESLNFKEVLNVSNDIEAMEFALKPGITGGIFEKSHLREGEEEEYLNSGYGLYIVTELCKVFKGHFSIISKGAIATKKGIKSLKDKLIFPGTAIKIRLQIPKDLTPEDFNEKLKIIISKGESISTQIEGAISTASTKSKSVF